MTALVQGELQVILSSPEVEDAAADDAGNFRAVLQYLLRSGVRTDTLPKE